jgi:deoxyribonuclease IV
MRIGLKLWSTNDFYIPPAQDFFKRKIFDYVELFTEPNSFRSHGSQWRDIGIPFVLHAPHSMQGLNLSLPDNLSKNKTYCEEVQLYFDLLQPDYVVFHPGIMGSALETVRQINLLKNDFPDLFKKALMENKPKIGLNNERCVGVLPEELEEIVRQTQIGFCLDFGHAICAAAAEGKGYQEVINRFMTLLPSMFHLTDGLTASFIDSHLHFGTGDFNLSWLIAKISEQDSVTIETVKNSRTDLDDFEKDVAALRKIRNGTN